MKESPTLALKKEDEERGREEETDPSPLGSSREKVDWWRARSPQLSGPHGAFITQGKLQYIQPSKRRSSAGTKANSLLYTRCWAWPRELGGGSAMGGQSEVIRRAKRDQFGPRNAESELQGNAHGTSQRAALRERAPKLLKTWAGKSRRWNDLLILESSLIAPKVRG